MTTLLDFIDYRLLEPLMVIPTGTIVVFELLQKNGLGCYAFCYSLTIYYIGEIIPLQITPASLE